MRSGKKILSIILTLIFALVLCSSCKNSDDGNKTVKIAVMGDKDNFYPDYEAGIKQAIDDLNSEYADKGFSFEYSVYDDGGSYEKGAQIIDELAADSSVTAVTGSLDMDINKTAAYLFNENKKLFVVPYVLYDSVYENNKYTTVFSLATTGKDIGKTLATAAVNETNAKRWAVCAADDDYSMSEMRGFLKIKNLNKNAGVVDCSDIVTLISDFDNELNRWNRLGVEGIALFPGKAYSSSDLFETLKKLRTTAPEIACMGDSRLDDSEVAGSDEELMKALNGVIMTTDFSEQTDDEENNEAFEKMTNEYAERNGSRFDLWYLQAYNMIRMIGDTAVKHNTNDSALLAKYLHEEGYDGLFQKFVFDENGSQMFKTIQYYVMNDDGTARGITINE